MVMVFLFIISFCLEWRVYSLVLINGWWRMGIDGLTFLLVFFFFSLFHTSIS